MSIFNRIVFAGDLSEPSRGAFAAACALAREPGAHLHILNVVEPVLLAEPPESVRGPRLPAVLPATNTAAHRKEVEDQLRAFYRADASIAVDYEVRAGHAAEEILRVADEINADLLVLGTQGRGGVNRMVCGSVAEAVMRRSSRPVLAVRSPDGAPREIAIRRILQPTDFSPRSWPALGVARALARANGAELILMHVAPAEILTGGAFYAPADLGPEKEELARLREDAAQAGLDGSVQSRFCQGDPVSEILLAAEDLRCDLIVMGSHGRTGLRRLLMGSVAESICRKAPCPTLIVKDGPAESAAAEEAAPVRDEAGVSA